MKKKNLIGQKFKKLTVISKAPNIKPKKGIGRSFVAWNCQCECGKIIVVRTVTLTEMAQKSCGCHISQFGIAIKPEQKFNKLTTISYGNGFWNCLCECGNTIRVLTHNLISNNTKSCGCLRSEKAKNNIRKAIKTNQLYHPRITSARRRWKSYCYQDELCDLTFEQWLDISQQNCFYCGTPPSNTFNYFLKKKDASLFSKENGDFTFNGLDRVDNSLPHIIDNVVSCCWLCNRAKSDRNIQDFYHYITMLKIKDHFVIPDNILPLPTGYMLVSIKGTYRHYACNYGIMEIDLLTFYNFSQLPCYYCEMKNSNYFNVYLKDKKASQAAKDGAHFYYNGIDRLDNSKTHTLDNIVPCCYYCNFAKGKLALPEFQAWIQRVKEYQHDKKN